MEAVFSPLEVRIGGNEDIKIEVGPEARAALRKDALRTLIGALEGIRAAEEAMPSMDDPTVRSLLEDLGTNLTWATRACDALWYLAPEYDDGQPVED